MGSQGMKRKNRQHLPKVGTRLANQQALHERREQAEHPFSKDPYDKRRSSTTAIIALVVIAVIGIAVFALILAT